MFVKYTPAKSHIKVVPLIPFTEGDKKYTFDNDSIILRPGTNELTEQEWKAIQPHIKAQLGKEIVAFSVDAKPGKGGGKKKAKCLKDVPVATARKIIQACQDPNTLKKWFNQELPDEILLVLSKQMRKLKVEPDDIKDDDTEALKDSDITPEGDDEETSETETAESESEETADEKDDDDDSEDEEIPDFDGSKEGK